MSLKADAIETGVVVLLVGAGLWYASRKLGSVASSVGAVVQGAANSVGGSVIDAYNMGTAPVLPTDSGVGAVDGAAAIGNGVVAAPTNVVDSLSMGLIGGSGGTAGNGGLGGWLWGIISGSAFAPSGADSTQVAPATNDAGIDLGNSSGW
ncbi:hypothetical protein [Burkholderia arboris]|uniref:hypothetical protein n=1 Tax=Burkholderia arboris TaxID=488730 RepID=UPI00210EDE10|nr:hypothetical protein [Burkholderia arboris]UTV53242.1 hypothetical protein NLX30_10090 [Burkholderia arboris]